MGSCLSTTNCAVKSVKCDGTPVGPRLSQGKQQQGSPPHQQGSAATASHAAVVAVSADSHVHCVAAQCKAAKGPPAASPARDPGDPVLAAGAPSQADAVPVPTFEAHVMQRVRHTAYFVISCSSYRRYCVICLRAATILTSCASQSPLANTPWPSHGS
jgi:hypothetical protein